MTADLHASFAAEAAANPRLAGVIPVGDAFQLAVDRGLVKIERLLRRERRLRAAAAGRPS